MRVLFLLLIMFISSCGSPTYSTSELLKEDKKSLEKASFIRETKARETLLLFTEVFSRYQREEISQSVSKLYASDAFLNDRIHSLKGSDNIAQYFDNTFEKMAKASFVVLEQIEGKKEAHLRWNMQIWLKNDEKPREFFGVSVLRFNKEGKIIYHQDFWDFSELLGTFTLSKGLINYVKQSL